MKSHFWISAVFVLCVATFDVIAQVTEGIHFYMPFNEGKGKVVKDVGPKGFEAELHDSAKFVRGKIGTAIEFSEGPAVIIDPRPGGPSKLYVAHLTVAVWIYPFEISDEVFGKGHLYGNIFYDKSGKSDDNVEFGLGSGEGLYWYINSGEKKMRPFNPADVNTTLSLPNLGLKPENWYHVVGTFDGEKVQIYLDGKLEGEKDVPRHGPVMLWNENDIHIGGRPNINDGTNLYKGLLDELVVYDRALTADEVVEVMNSTNILTVDFAGKLTTIWGTLKTK